MTYGSLANKGTLVAVVGLAVMAALMARRVTGAILIGIVTATLLALVLGVAKLPGALHPPSFEVAFKANVWDALRADLLPLLLAIVLVDFFDTLGTASAIADQAGLRDESGEIPRLRPLLIVDSVAASIGGLFGASSVTSYVESAAGVAEGARTGLHTVLVGLMFFGAILLAPFAGIVPAQATAPALILVGFLMIAQVTSIDWDHVDTAIPAFVTLVTLPMTYSISHGIGYGFGAYVLIKLLTGRWREIHPLLAAATLAFGVYFAWGKG